MRGTREQGLDAAERVGIIPAYAGNTSCVKSPPTSSGDHPRVCGEHVNASRFHQWPTGSSPRMRGTQADLLTAKRKRGIIPAYAGNTAVKQTPLGGGRDHPRVCGEHLTENEAHRMGEGSSPRMRGTPRCAMVRARPTGIIPAYAGNTCTARLRDPTI